MSYYENEGNIEWVKKEVKKPKGKILAALEKTDQFCSILQQEVRNTILQYYQLGPQIRRFPIVKGNASSMFQSPDWNNVETWENLKQTKKDLLIQAYGTDLWHYYSCFHKLYENNFDASKTAIKEKEKESTLLQICASNIIKYYLYDMNGMGIPYNRQQELIKLIKEVEKEQKENVALIKK